MANPTDLSKKDMSPKKDDPVKEGKKAIEMNKEINRTNKPEEQVNKEEEKDAEKWRNEG